MRHARHPHLSVERGAIVNIGAMARSGRQRHGAPMPRPRRRACLTEALAAELKGQVTVNAVLPSTIDTPATAPACLKPILPMGDAEELAKSSCFSRRFASAVTARCCCERAV